jgi:PhnB protein
MSDVAPIPEGYNNITPYLIVKDAAKAIEFYESVFDAYTRLRMAAPDGRVMHAELEIGDSAIMLADECPERGAKRPLTIGGTPVMIHLYVEDCDDVFKRGIAAGAKEVRPLQDQFYGDRSGMFADPFGHQWNIATHIEDVSEEQMKERMAAMNKE